MTKRRGFTMIELMVALVMTVLVGAVIYRLLINNQRVSRGQTARVGVQDNVRAGAIIAANELREIGYDSVPATADPTLVLNLTSVASTDLLAAQPGLIRYRAMRGFGVVCAAPTTAQLKLSRKFLYELRDPVANDNVAIFVEGDNSKGSDDAWVRATVTGTSATNCADGSAALGVNISWPVSAVGTAAVGKMTVGSPARVFEVMEMQYYASGGQSWLGMRSVSQGGVIAPVVGPLADSTAGQRGLTFRYWDKDNVETAVVPNVRAVTLTLRGVTDERVYKSGGTSNAVDTLVTTTRVALRNALRP